MLASTLADSVSRSLRMLSVNSSRKPLRLRAMPATMASAYSYHRPPRSARLPRTTTADGSGLAVPIFEPLANNALRGLIEALPLHPGATVDLVKVDRPTLRCVRCFRPPRPDDDVSTCRIVDDGRPSNGSAPLRQMLTALPICRHLDLSNRHIHRHPRFAPASRLPSPLGEATRRQATPPPCRDAATAGAQTP